MAWLAAVGVGMQVIGGIKERQAAKYSEAVARQRGEETKEVLDDEAVQTVAAAQRSALSQERVANFVESRAKAVAAASGAGASDPSVVNLISRISAEGALRSLTSIYEGEERARKLRISGDMAERYGVQQGEGYSMIAQAGGIKAASSAAAGASSLYAKYGAKSDTTSSYKTNPDSWNYGNE